MINNIIQFSKIYKSSMKRKYLHVDSLSLKLDLELYLSGSCCEREKGSSHHWGWHKVKLKVAEHPLNCYFLLKTQFPVAPTRWPDNVRSRVHWMFGEHFLTRWDTTWHNDLLMPIFRNGVCDWLVMPSEVFRGSSCHHTEDVERKCCPSIFTHLSSFQVWRDNLYSWTMNYYVGNCVACIF